MELSRKQLEALLIAYHRIDPDRADTFRSRIKTLQRMGFPPGTNVGRGPKMTYSAVHFFQLITVFELQQIGLPADRAATATLRRWPQLREGYGIAFSLREDRSPAEPDERIVAWVIVRALAELQIDRGPGQRDPFIRVMTARQLMERLGSGHGTGMVQSVVVLRMSDIIEQVARAAYFVGVKMHRDVELSGWATLGTLPDNQAVEETSNASNSKA